MPTLQLIVITHSRAASLRRLLGSLRAAYYDGDRVDLHIWIDRASRKGIRRRVLGDMGPNAEVVALALQFEWGHGAKFVHVWDRHVGIWGQWLESYKGGEGAVPGLLLEDDLEVSKQYYRWLRRVSQLCGRRDDVFGYTLQRGTLRANGTGFGKRPIRVGEEEGMFFYLLVGSWGYMPVPARWGEFRKWFREKSCKRGFRPYVEGLTPTKWYKRQERQRTMWTMWHIYYADMKKLYTVYANLKGPCTLAANWREPGLHFSEGGRGKTGRAVGVRDFKLCEEDVRALSLTDDPVKLGWNGTYIGRNGVRTRR